MVVWFALDDEGEEKGKVGRRAAWMKALRGWRWSRWTWLDACVKIDGGELIRGLAIA